MKKKVVCVCVCVCVCEADVFVVAWGARCGSGRDHGRRRRNQTKSKGDARVVAGRAGEGRHQLRRDYKKKKRERELGGRIEGGNRQKRKKKEGGRPLSPRLFFIQMGKRTVGNLTKSTKRFLFVFVFFFVRFVRSSSFSGHGPFSSSSSSSPWTISRPENDENQTNGKDI